MASKKSPRKPSPAKIINSIKSPTEKLLVNGLADAVLGGGIGVGGYPFNNGSIGTQLNQTATLFKNNRWYLVSNMRQLLSESYVEHGLIQTIVDVPVDDGLRGGVEIKSKQLSEEQIEQLQVTMERENDLGVVGQGVKWNRLFGGAGVVVVTDQDPNLPLDVDAIGPDTPLEFYAADMWELFYSRQNTTDYAAAIDGNVPDVAFYNYYGINLHESRVMLMRGIEAPSFIRPRLRGWGVSTIEILINSINQYLKANNLIFEVLDEFKVDVYKMKNLVNTLLSKDGSQRVFDRIQLANLQKNYQNAITMDSEDDFVSKELSFTGIAETMQGIRLQVASDMRMPLTKIFGISATGFSTGAEDIENYNAMVESQVRQKVKFHILKVIELRCQKLFGFIPDDMSVTFRPLRVLSAEQEENVKNAQFARMLQCMQAGLMDVKEFKEGLNRNDLLPIQLDTSIDMIEQGDEVDDDDDDDEDGSGGGDDKKSAPLKKLPKDKMTVKDVKNSLEFDLAGFKADGGLGMYDERRKELYVSPKDHKDPGKWAQAQQDSEKLFGKEVWQFVAWLYKKRGGEFK